MKIRTFTIVAGAAIAVTMTASFISNTAKAADAAASASATIVAPITISQTTALAYGNLAPTGTAGTAIIDTADSLSSSNVDTLSGITPASGAFSVTGSGTSNYTVTLPTTVTLSDGGSNSMTLSSFNHNAGATPSLSGGTGTFKVGATLGVGASQVAGAYSGSYTVTVNYQ